MNRGRAAFKESSSDDHNNDASIRAMRSFTQSIECDLPPAPTLPPSLNIDQLGYSDETLSIRREDTNDTIIEVLQKSEEPDRTMGETQKYKMTVPGPGHIDQETELHRSLLKDEQSIDIEQVSPEELSFPKPVRPTSMADSNGSFARALRDHHTKTTQLQSRPRPTTPVQSCALESFAFILPDEELEKAKELKRKEEERMKVIIPSRRPRTSSMSYSEFVDNMSSQMPPQVRSMIDYRSDNEDDIDILEHQPAYKKKAPSAPVKHRRSSIEWENFEEAKDQVQTNIEEIKDQVQGNFHEIKTQVQADVAEIKDQVQADVAEIKDQVQADVTEIKDQAESLTKREEEEEEDTVIAQSSFNTQKMDEDEVPQFSEDMEEERVKVLEERRRTQSISNELKKEKEEEEEEEEEESEEENPLFKKMPLHQKKSTSKEQSIIKKSTVSSQGSLSKQMSLQSQSSIVFNSSKRSSIQHESTLYKQSSMQRQGSQSSTGGPTHPPPGYKGPPSRQGSMAKPTSSESINRMHRMNSLNSQGKKKSITGREESIDEKNESIERIESIGERKESIKDRIESINEEGITEEPTQNPSTDQYEHNGEYQYEDYQYTEGEGGQYEYDPNAYPGYRWNYDTQEWEATGEDTTSTVVEGTGQEQQYDPNAQYDYSGYEQGGTDYYQGYDQNTQSYDPSVYPTTTEGEQPQYDYSQYPGYDQSQGFDQAAYDAYYAQNSQYNAGYDQPGDGTVASTYQYDQSVLPSSTVDGTNGGDSTTTTAYDTSAAYDPSAYYQGYDQNQQYDYSQYYANYAQQAYSTDQNLSVNTAYDGYQGAYEGYGGQPVGEADHSGYATSNDASPYPQASPAGYPSSNTDQYGWEGHESTVETTEIPPVVVETNDIEELDRTKEVHEEDHTTTKAPPPRPPPASPSRPPPPRPSAPTISSTAPNGSSTAPNGSSTAPPVPPPPSSTRTPHPPPVPAPPKKKEEVEEDAWTRFNKMTAKVTDLVKTTESSLKNLEETSAAKDIKDESYLATVGGEQGYFNSEVHRSIMNKKEELAKEKAIKKKMKARGKKTPSPPLDPNHDDDMDRKAMELAAKLAQNRPEFEGWRPDIKAVTTVKKDSVSGIPPRKRSSLQDSKQDSGSVDLPGGDVQSVDGVQPIGDLPPNDPSLSQPTWSNNFDNIELPASDSGFFFKSEIESVDPFVVNTSTNDDPFAPKGGDLIDENFDPFAVKPVEEIVAAAKAKAEVIAASRNTEEDDDVYDRDRRSEVSTPTEPGSPVNGERPNAFDDEFKVDPSQLSTPTPLYDEDDTIPLGPYIEPFTEEGWELMLRHPLKKKLMADRFWKPCYVRIRGNTLYIFNDKNDQRPIQETLLQSTYSMSDTTLQAYDVYGKLHTVKLQYVQYKERVGIRQGQIARLMEGHVTKYGVPLEHSAQCTVIAKFGSLNANSLQSFIGVVEDILFHCPAKRDSAPVYKQDEVQVHCCDEYSCYIDKDGIISDQKARVRLYCLAFVTGKPFLEIGLNDRRRQGKEIVRRKDILPMYTERWIRFENLEFHSIVDQKAFDDEQVIKIPPPDGCFFELMRFRVRPPQNREKNLTVKAMMKIAGSKVEIRIEAMAAANASKSRGTAESRRTIPCEDICIRFPIPEAWIYIFREERHWGVGSVHAKKLKPGKVKNLKDRLLGAVQQVESHLIEVGTGEAKYEHVYRSLVWRIPRLPKEQQEAYKSYTLKCRFELSSFDLMPDEFLPNAEVDFTMPLATISNTVVRSISVEQHEDPDRVEKFVRYVAKSHYRLAIDYVQCMDLDAETTLASKPNMEDLEMPDMHRPTMHPNEIGDMHEGYRIDLPEESRYESKRRDSSSDEEDEKDNRKMPMVKIDMSNYGY